MSKRFLLVAMLVTCGAHAQTIILKCVDKRGHVSYTTDACEAGQAVKDIKAYGPVRDDPRARDDVRRIDEQMQARYRDGHRTIVYPGVTPSETPRDKQKRACAQARQHAADARGKGYNSSTLVSLDKAAVDACFGL
jgi:hypothetical protein